ncbi:MAG: class I SAM-dependent methyltransferase, partial [Gaiellaceae bacterium]
SYLDPFRYEDTFERGGLRMDFASMHRPLEAYSKALEAAGLAVESLREPPLPEDAYRDEASARWRRVPLFLYVRARRLA